MCGATFDNAQADEDKSKSQQQRVRHDTSSTTVQDVEPKSPPMPPKSPSPAPSGMSFKAPKQEPAFNGPDLDDPLRGFLQEVEAEQETADEAPGMNGASHSEPVKPVPPASRPVPVQAQPKQPPPQPQVVVESGRGRPGGLSFGKSEQRKVDPAPAPKPEPKREAPQPPPAAPKPSFSPKPEPQQARQQPAPQPQAREQRPEQRKAEPQKAPANRPIIHEGDLVGWLVDYRDSKGNGLEMREAQFFITRERLKSSDMVFDDESISTPHAMVRVTRQNGVEVQDLMSETGIRIKRRDSTAWQPVEERVRLQHGDRVQFGTIEYLIVLVPFE